MAETDITKPTDLAAVQAALAQGDGLSAAKLVGSAAAQVTKTDGVATSYAKTKLLTDYLDAKHVTAIRTGNYASMTQGDMEDMTDRINNAGWEARVGFKLILPPGLIKTIKPLTAAWSRCIFQGINGVQGFVSNDPDTGYLRGATIFAPDLSIDWGVEHPGRGVLETPNFSWNGESAKPDFYTNGAIENVVVDCARDPLYATHPNRVPDFGVVAWCPSDITELRKNAVYHAGRHGILVGGLQASGLLYNCQAWHTGANQETAFGETITRPSSPFTSPVAVWGSFDPAQSQQGVALECADPAVLTSIASGQTLIVTTKSGQQIPLTVHAQSQMATQTITQTTQVNGVITTTRAYRVVRFNEAINVRLVGRQFCWGIALRDHPDTNFAPGISAADGGQGSDGDCCMILPGGDYNRDALIGMDGAQKLTIVSPKSEYNAALLDVTGNYAGGSRASIVVQGGKAIINSGRTQYAAVRITGTATPALDINTPGRPGYTLALVDLTPGAVGPTGVQQTGALPFGNNILTSAQAGGSFKWCLTGTDFDVFRRGYFTGAWVGGTGILNVFNGPDDGFSFRYTVYQENVGVSLRLTWGAAPSSTHMTREGVKGEAGKGVTYFGHYAAAAGSDKSRPLLSLATDGLWLGRSGAPIGFYEKTPVVQQTITAAATDATTTQALVNSMADALLATGLVKR